MKEVQFGSLEESFDKVTIQARSRYQILSTWRFKPYAFYD